MSIRDIAEKMGSQAALDGILSKEAGISSLIKNVIKDISPVISKKVKGVTPGFKKMKKGLKIMSHPKSKKIQVGNKTMYDVGKQVFTDGFKEGPGVILGGAGAIYGVHKLTKEPVQHVLESDIGRE